MKKMIITPKKDTITICLPPEWVGKPLVCTLGTPYEQSEDEVISQVSESSMAYKAERVLDSAPGRPARTKRLRKRYFSASWRR